MSVVDTIVNWIVGPGSPACTAEEDSCQATQNLPEAGSLGIDPESIPASGVVTFGDPLTFFISANACGGGHDRFSVTFEWGPYVREMTRNSEGLYTVTVDAVFASAPARVRIKDLNRGTELVRELWQLPRVEAAEEPYDVCEHYPTPNIEGDVLQLDRSPSDISVGDSVTAFLQTNRVIQCDGITGADPDNSLEVNFYVYTPTGDLRIPAQNNGSHYYCEHDFTEEGLHEIVLVATNRSRSASISTGTFWVQGGGETSDLPPVAIIAPFWAYIGEDVPFTSPSPDETLYSYIWEFRDGTLPVSGPSVTHAFASGGIYQVKLTVAYLDRPELESVLYHNITIVPPGIDVPALSIVAPDAAEEDTLVSISVGDPDPVDWDYGWQFGDGERGSGPAVTNLYLNPGTYTIILTATNRIDPTQTYSISRIITIISHGNPVPNLVITPGMGRAPLTVTADASASYPTAWGGTITNYRFNWGDTSPEESGPAGSRVHTYTCASSSCGYTVRVTVEDSYGGTSSITAAVSTWR